MFGPVRTSALVVALVSVIALPGAVLANHSWAGYHWARTSNPFTLKLGDNVSSGWDSYLATSRSDWNATPALDLTIVPGRTKPRTCDATAGRIEVCSARYGDTGWLGVASIAVTGESHITQATVRLNDTYLSAAPYNTVAWRNLVMCQEVGHTLGLNHQDEDFDDPNLGTCMDHTRRPKSNQHPNQHDHDHLSVIYGHQDSTTTVGQATPSDTTSADTSAAWGREVSRLSDGRASVFVRDLGAGNSMITRVIWAD